MVLHQTPQSVGEVPTSHINGWRWSCLAYQSIVRCRWLLLVDRYLYIRFVRAMCHMATSY